MAVITNARVFISGRRDLLRTNLMRGRSFAPPEERLRSGGRLRSRSAIPSCATHKAKASIAEAFVFETLKPALDFSLPGPLLILALRSPVHRFHQQPAQLVAAFQIGAYDFKAYFIHA